MGLLEQLLAKLDIAIELLQNGHTVEATAAVKEVSETVTGETGAANDDDDTDGVELDKAGTPWDERIHSGTKPDPVGGKTNKGIWKRRRNITDELYSTVLAEITGDQGESSEPAKKAPPAKPAKKAPPAKPGVKTPPSKSAPPKKDLPTDKSTAIKTLSELGNVHGASADDLLAFVSSQFGVDTYDEISSKDHTKLRLDTDKWLENLGLCQDEIDALKKMSEGSEHAEDIEVAIEAFITEAGGRDTLGSVPFENIFDLVKDLSEYADQWTEFFKED